MPMVTTSANAWRERGFQDARAGRKARTPIRDDNGEAAAAYLVGYRNGKKRPT